MYFLLVHTTDRQRMCEIYIQAPYSWKKATQRRAKRSLKQMYIVLNTSDNNADRSLTFCMVCTHAPHNIN